MRLIIALLLSLLPAFAFASPPEPEDKYLSKTCRVTPQIKPVDGYPGRAAIVPSNKLPLPAGKSEYAKGELIFLSGRVLDENCVPVSDAIIDIWQADPHGKYSKPTMAGRVSPEPYFTGSGRAVSDNLGQYNFVTLFPASSSYGHHHRSPHIHVHVIKKGLRTLDTEIFFDGDKRNAADPKLKNMPESLRPLIMVKVWPRDKDKPEEGLAGQWDITLKGKNDYRHF